MMKAIPVILFLAGSLAHAQLPQVIAPISAAGAADAVAGGASLTAVGAIPRISSSGTVAESKLTITASPVTATLYDNTPTTGVTLLVIRAGAGQSTTNIQQWNASGGGILSFVDSSGGLSAPYAVLTSGEAKWATGTEGTCNGANRGRLVMVQGGAGVADTFRVCAKDISDVYGWRALF